MKRVIYLSRMDTVNGEPAFLLFTEQFFILLQSLSIAQLLDDPLCREILIRFLNHNERNVVYERELMYVSIFNLCTDILLNIPLFEDQETRNKLLNMINDWQTPADPPFTILTNYVPGTNVETIRNEIWRFRDTITRQVAYLPGFRSFWYHLHSRGNQIINIMRSLYFLIPITR